MLGEGLAGLRDIDIDVCVVGSGPVGLALATTLARRGRRVLILESGGKTPDKAIQALSQAQLVDPRVHDDSLIVAARCLGGTSNLWGARALPYDPIDFEPRSWIDARWPVGYAELEPYFPAVVAATRSGAPVYREPIPNFEAAEGDFACDHLERWANVQRAQEIHAEAIAADPRLIVRLFATVVGLEFEESGRVVAVTVADSRSGETLRLPIQTLVIAAGGLESVRLLLASQRDAPSRFGGPDGPLGRYYMGHLVGSVADIVLSSKQVDQAFDFRVDSHGSYVRRRITPSDALQRREGLLNCALWPTVPPIADPRHGSAILSMMYLAMSIGPFARLFVAEAIRQMHVSDGPIHRLPHLVNLIRGAPAAATFLASFMQQRYFSEARLPGFFIHNRAHRYSLSYHSEQSPDPDSRVTLSHTLNRLGLPELIIDLRFRAEDAASIVRTHDWLGAWVERVGLGRLELHGSRAECEASVLEQASHGTHQIGIARMGATRRDGVVDADLATFDAPNLYVASAGVLPTSGQANPTFTAMALALRLADRLAPVA